MCWARSEEHTSELQSQSNLVCRLLLEKKKRSELSSFFRGLLGSDAVVLLSYNMDRVILELHPALLRVTPHAPLPVYPRRCSSVVHSRCSEGDGDLSMS